MYVGVETLTNIMHMFFSFYQIVEARNVILQKLGERKDTQAGECETSSIVDTHQEGRGDSERDSIPFEQNLILTEVTNATKGLEIDDMISSKKWSEKTDTDATSLTSCTKLKQEEDVSCSDLEDYRSDSSDKLSGHGEACRQKAVPFKGKDSEDESNDWLTVDEFNQVDFS